MAEAHLVPSIRVFAAPFSVCACGCNVLVVVVAHPPGNQRAVRYPDRTRTLFSSSCMRFERIVRQPTDVDMHYYSLLRWKHWNCVTRGNNNLNFKPTHSIAEHSFETSEEWIFPNAKHQSPRQNANSNFLGAFIHAMILSVRFTSVQFDFHPAGIDLRYVQLFINIQLVGLCKWQWRWRKLTCHCRDWAYSLNRQFHFFLRIEFE